LLKHPPIPLIIGGSSTNLAKSFSLLDNKGMRWMHDEATDFDIQMPEDWIIGSSMRNLISDHPLLRGKDVPQDLREWLQAAEDDPSLNQEFHWAALKVYQDPQTEQFHAAYCWMKKGYLTGHLKENPGVHMKTEFGEGVINQSPLEYIQGQPSLFMIGLLEELDTKATLALVMCSRGEVVEDQFQQDMIFALDHLHFHSHRRPNWGLVQAAGLGGVALAALAYNIFS